MTYLDGVSISRSHSVRLPCHPLIATSTDVLRVQPEVGNALVTVDQLTKSTGQLTIGDVTVVGEVKKLDVRTATVALPHAVRHDAV